MPKSNKNLPKPELGFLAGQKGRVCQALRNLTREVDGFTLADALDYYRHHVPCCRDRLASHLLSDDVRLGLRIRIAFDAMLLETLSAAIIKEGASSNDQISPDCSH